MFKRVFERFTMFNIRLKAFLRGLRCLLAYKSVFERSKMFISV